MALPHRILVATDFSDGSNRALDLASELAATLAVPLVVVHAYLTTVVLDDDERWPHREIEDSPRHAALEAQLGRCLERARRHRAPRVESALVKGDAPSQILRVANDRDCDLIVIGPDGASRVRDGIGAVATKIVRDAHCPVLVAGHA